MDDHLENFVKENRQQFDEAEPSENVWGGIYGQLNKSTSNFSWLWKAAAVLFFMTSSFLLYQSWHAPQGLAGNTAVISDFRSVERFYFQKISEKKGMIHDFEESQINYDEAFEQDLQKLDAMYLVLKDEFSDNPSKKVVDAMVLNLLVRVDILNKALERLEEKRESDMRNV